jgi:hypothetical protein
MILKKEDLIDAAKDLPLDLAKDIIKRMKSERPWLIDKQILERFQRNGINAIHWTIQPEGSAFWNDLYDKHDYEKYFKRFPREFRSKRISFQGNIYSLGHSEKGASCSKCGVFTACMELRKKHKLSPCGDDTFHTYLNRDYQHFYPFEIEKFETYD